MFSLTQYGYHIAHETYFPMGNNEFYDCEFRPTKFLQSSISDNYWEGCRFVGDFRGTHFGAATDFNDIPTRWPEIAVRGCDFSRATMNGCWICRLEISTTIFPVWPCFTVINPAQNLNAWKAAALPFSTRFFEYTSLDESVSAVMYHWPQASKGYKIDPALDPEVVREALSKLDFIRL